MTSNDELIDLLDTKAPDFCCSACGNIRFAFMNRHVLDGIETLSVACTNCGKIERFAVQLLKGDYGRDRSDG